MPETADIYAVGIRKRTALVAQAAALASGAGPAWARPATRRTPETHPFRVTKTVRVLAPRVTLTRISDSSRDP